MYAIAMLKDRYLAAPIIADLKKKMAPVAQRSQREAH